MERGTILICIFSNFIFVQDVPYYNHAAGPPASMIIGKILALISLRGVVSSQRLHGVVIDTTLLATGSSYGKILALASRGVIISERSSSPSSASPPEMYLTSHAAGWTAPVTWKNPCPHSLRGGSCLQRESTGVVFIDNTLLLSHRRWLRKNPCSHHERGK